MEGILSILKNGGTVANIEIYNNFTFETETSGRVSLFPSDNELSPTSDDRTEINLSLHLNDRNFDLDNVLAEIGYKISMRRKLLKYHGAIENITPKDNKAIAKWFFLQNNKALRQYHDFERAIGLWCWDQTIEEKYPHYKPGIYPKDDSLMKISFEKCLPPAKLLLKLREKGFCLHDLLSSPSTPDARVGDCQKAYGNHTGKIIAKDRDCPLFDACKRRLRELRDNANNCIDNMSVLKLSEDRQKKMATQPTCKI